jgi:hypothetical protein
MRETHVPNEGISVAIPGSPSLSELYLYVSIMPSKNTFWS